MKHIYKITNTINDKTYIGQSKQTSVRWRDHIASSKMTPETLRFNSALYEEMREYGTDKFTFETIEEVSDEKAYEKEQFWIKELNTLYPNGYNLTSGGEKGKFYSDITKERIGEKTKERWEDPVIAERMLNGLRLGTETVKRTHTGKERVERLIKTCPECGIEFRVIPSEDKTFCSYSCSGRYRMTKGSGKQRIEEYVEERKSVHTRIKELAENWTEENKERVIEGKLNDITATLKPLTDLIEEEYEVKDYRTISKAISGTESRKKLLLYLKEYAQNINV